MRLILGTLVTQRLLAVGMIAGFLHIHGMPICKSIFLVKYNFNIDAITYLNNSFVNSFSRSINTFSYTMAKYFIEKNFHTLFAALFDRMEEMKFLWRIIINKKFRKSLFIIGSNWFELRFTLTRKKITICMINSCVKMSYLKQLTLDVIILYFVWELLCSTAKSNFHVLSLFQPLWVNGTLWSFWKLATTCLATLKMEISKIEMYISSTQIRISNEEN